MGCCWIGGVLMKCEFCHVSNRVMFACDDISARVFCDSGPGTFRSWNDIGQFEGLCGRYLVLFVHCHRNGPPGMKSERLQFLC